MSAKIISTRSQNVAPTLPEIKALLYYLDKQGCHQENLLLSAWGTILWWDFPPDEVLAHFDEIMSQLRRGIAQRVRTDNRQMTQRRSWSTGRFESGVRWTNAAKIEMEDAALNHIMILWEKVREPSPAPLVTSVMARRNV